MVSEGKVENRIRIANWPEPIYNCVLPDGCGQYLTAMETVVVRLWWFALVKVRRCRWCGKVVSVAKCSFQGCDKEALQLDWDRQQDVEIPFCMSHCYHGEGER